MEVPVEIDSRIVSWLSSMGYPVSGMPPELLHRMLLREARQWQLAPSKLAAIIQDGGRQSASVETEMRGANRDQPVQRRSYRYAGTHKW